MKILIYIFKLILKSIYLILKMLPTNDKKVVFISRQSNNVSLDFKILSDEIIKLDKDYKTIFLCEKMSNKFTKRIKYFFSIIRQMYHLATSRVCVIDSYCIAVSVLNHKKNLVIIQLWHSLAAIKKFGFQTVGKDFGRDKKISEYLNMHKNYDYVISGSDAMIPFFSEAFNVDKSKIKSIGAPKIDYLLKEQKFIKQKILSKYKNINKKKIILYAPTFRKDKKININKILDTVDFNKYNLIVKVHPGKKQKFNNESIYECNEFSTFELLTIADYVITDYSAISVEATILNKPLYFYLYDIVEYEEKNGLNIDLYKEMEGCCYRNFKSLYKKLDSNNYNMKQLQRFKDKYLTNQNDNSGYILANFIVNGIWLPINKNKKLKIKNKVRSTQ